jgi:hypothetical protein
MDEEAFELKEKIMHLSDDQLLQMVTVDAGEYRKEALDYAKAELLARGIDVANAAAEIADTELADKVEGRGSLDSRGLLCPTCGGRIRSGTLIAEKELSIIFNDNREERFVKVTACSQCGQLSLTVDYDEEVQR